MSQNDLAVCIRLYHGDEVYTHFVDKDEFVIGRSEECDFCLNVDGVSRKHLEIQVKKGQIFVKDLGSSYGTFLQGSRIPSNHLVEYKKSAQVILAKLGVFLTLETINTFNNSEYIEFKEKDKINIAEQLKGVLHNISNKNIEENNDIIKRPNHHKHKIENISQSNKREYVKSTEMAYSVVDIFKLNEIKENLTRELDQRRLESLSLKKDIENFGTQRDDQLSQIQKLQHKIEVLEAQLESVNENYLVTQKNAAEKIEDLKQELRRLDENKDQAIEIKEVALKEEKLAKERYLEFLEKHNKLRDSEIELKDSKEKLESQIADLVRKAEQAEENLDLWTKEESAKAHSLENITQELKEARAEFAKNLSEQETLLQGSKSNIEACEEKVAELDGFIEERSQKLSSLEDQIVKAIETKQEYVAFFKEYHEEKQKKDELLDKIEVELADLENRKSAKENDILALNEKFEILTKSESELTKEIEDRKQNLLSLSRSQDELIEEISLKQKYYEAISEEKNQGIKDLEEKFDSMLDQIAKNESDYKISQDRNKHIVEQISSLELEKSKLEQKEMDLITQIAEKKRKKNELDDQLNGKQLELKKIEDKKSGLELETRQIEERQESERKLQIRLLEEIKQEVMDVEIELHNNRKFLAEGESNTNELKEVVAKLKGEAEKTEIICQKLKEDKHAMETDIEQKRIQAKDLDASMLSVKASLATNTKELAALEEKKKLFLAEQKQEQESLQVSLETLSMEIKNSEEGKYNLQKDIESAKLELSSLKEELSNFEVQKEQLVDLKAELLKVTENLEAAKKEGDEKDLRLQKLIKDVEDRQHHMNELGLASELETKKITEARKEFSDLKIEHSKLDTDTEDLKTYFEQLKLETENFKLESFKASKEKDSALEQLKLENQRLDLAKDKLSHLQEQVSLKEDYRRTLESAEKDSKKVIEAMKQEVSVEKDKKKALQAEQETLYQEISKQKLSLEDLNRKIGELDSLRANAQEHIDEELDQKRQEAEAKFLEWKSEKSSAIEASSAQELSEIKAKTQRELGLMQSRFEAKRREYEDRFDALRTQNFARLEFQMDQFFAVNSKYGDECKQGVIEVLRSSFGLTEHHDEETLTNLNYIPRADATRKMMQFYGKRGAIVLSVLLCFLFRSEISSTILKIIPQPDQTASDIFVERIQREIASKPQFNPAKVSEYGPTYTDNVLYLEEYLQKYTKEDLLKRRTLELNRFFDEDLKLSENAIVKFIAEERVLIRDLAELMNKINPRYEKEGITRMRKREIESRDKLIELLSGIENFKKFQDKDAEFFTN